MKFSLTITPPGPVTDQVEIEIRWAVFAGPESVHDLRVGILLDGAPVAPEETLSLAAGEITGRSFRLETRNLKGDHAITVSAAGEPDRSVSRPITVVPSSVWSTGRLGGAWVGVSSWSETEGLYWNQELARFTEADWRDLVRGMKALGLSTIIIQETWRNDTCYGIHYHQMTEANYRSTYAGRAYYPSKLWPARMPGLEDPIGVILDEAGRQDMQVLLGLGMYAHFDYSPGSLAWHREVLRELWALYGHHPALYGWYVSEELNGGIRPHEERYWDKTEEFRADVLTFFETLHGDIRALAPHTVLMLAPNASHVGEAAAVWPKLVRHCDILCVQGYQRAPVGRLSVQESLRLMQEWCDAVGCHHWMDFELFGFEHPDKPGPQREGFFKILPDGTQDWIPTPLIPQTIGRIREELARLNTFEFVCAYQYPGLLCAPGSRLTPGGNRAVQLYKDLLELTRTPHQ